MRCPQCGLAIKVTNQPPDTCPVCGAKLPVVPAGKKGPPERKGPISLEQALFKSPRAKESWAPRELLNAFLLTFFVVMIADYLVVASGASFIQNDQFDPILYFSINMAGILVGITPVIYILLNKMNVRKLALKQINSVQWVWAVVLGIACGFGLYVVQRLGGIINLAIGLVPSTPSQAESQYSVFMLSIGNKLFMLLPVAVAQVVGEFFYRGMVLNGLLQWLRKRLPPLAAAKVKLRAWILSVLFGMLFDFALFFNPVTIIPSLLVHAIVGALFIFTENVQAGMIAQGTYVLLLILFY
jgi:hypothetical protein